MPHLDDPIGKAVEFLRNAQLATGEFRTLLGSDPRMSNSLFDSSPFVTTFVVYGLSHIDHTAAGTMIAKALAFLGREMEIGGVWRYWGRNQYKHRRLPPDLDDTACASYALQSNGKQAPRNRWLFCANRDEAGRFLTWVTPRPKTSLLSPFRLRCAIGDLQAERSRRRAPRPVVASDPRLLTTDHDPVPIEDIDPVVNANAILYLGEGPDAAPAVRWLNAMIKGEAPVPESLYYKDILALYYMIARACRHSAPSLAESGERLIELTLMRQTADGGFGGSLSTALAASVLLTFDPENAVLRDAVDFIVRHQCPDGSWEMEAFYSAPREFWGSPELTTAFCVEVLARYQKSVSGRVASPINGYR
jgi:hypothetical protein